MLKVIPLSRETWRSDVNQAHMAWESDKVKVIHFKAAALAEHEIMEFYENLAPQLGTVHYLAESVLAGDRSRQRTNEIWFEVRYDPNFPDAYRHSKNAQPLHTDGSYIPSYPNSTLMYCIANSETGGETIFLNSDDFINALREEAPGLLSDLLETPIRHARSGDSRLSHVIQSVGGVNKLYWNYYCVDPAAGRQTHALADKLFDFLSRSAIIKRSIVAVKLAPGEAVVWKDDEILHGRNSFDAKQTSERFIKKCAIDFGRFA